MSKEQQYKYNVYFEVVERGEGRSRFFTLIDNKGYMCGIFATKRHAIDAIPKIRRNLIREYKRRENLSKKSTTV